MDKTIELAKILRNDLESKFSETELDKYVIMCENDNINGYNVFIFNTLFNEYNCYISLVDDLYCIKFNEDYRSINPTKELNSICMTEKEFMRDIPKYVNFITEKLKAHYKL